MAQVSERPTYSVLVHCGLSLLCVGKGGSGITPEDVAFTSTLPRAPSAALSAALSVELSVACGLVCPCDPHTSGLPGGACVTLQRLCDPGRPWPQSFLCVSGRGSGRPVLHSLRARCCCCCCCLESSTEFSSGLLFLQQPVGRGGVPAASCWSCWAAWTGSRWPARLGPAWEQRSSALRRVPGPSCRSGRESEGPRVGHEVPECPPRGSAAGQGPAPPGPSPSTLWRESSRAS